MEYSLKNRTKKFQVLPKTQIRNPKKTNKIKSYPKRIAKPLVNHRHSAMKNQIQIATAKNYQIITRNLRRRLKIVKNRRKMNLISLMKMKWKTNRMVMMMMMKTTITFLIREMIRTPNLNKMKLNKKLKIQNKKGIQTQMPLKDFSRKVKILTPRMKQVPKTARKKNQVKTTNLLEKVTRKVQILVKKVMETMMMN